MHFPYIYNKDLMRTLQGMHQEDPSALYIYIYDMDLIRKLEGMHQEDPGEYSMHL